MKIEMYDNNIKVPSSQEVKQMGKIAHLIYATPKMGTIVEYAGRTCYQSFDKINEDSYKKFITAIVKSGHESVIEHSNLVFVIFKENNKELGIDCNNINRHLINVMMYNGLLTISECQAYYLISGNIRMFKDVIRKYLEVKAISGKVNKIIDDMISEIYNLPSYFFIDMIQRGMLDEAKFMANQRFIDHDNNMVFKKINDYLTIINHDSFNFKIRGFVVKDKNGNSITKKISTPTSILKKHNRLTVVLNAPRFITHQIVRHRVFSYSQRSQRYVLESGINVWVPESIKESGLQNLMDFAIKNSFNVYNELVNKKIKKEDARSVLPESSMSTIVMTGTVEQFFDFVKLRADNAAQNMVRDYIAKPLLQYLTEYYKKSDDSGVTPEYKKNTSMISVSNEKVKQPKKKKKVIQKETQKKREVVNKFTNTNNNKEQNHQRQFHQKSQSQYQQRRTYHSDTEKKEIRIPKLNNTNNNNNNRKPFYQKKKWFD